MASRSLVLGGMALLAASIAACALFANLDAYSSAGDDAATPKVDGTAPPVDGAVADVGRPPDAGNPADSSVIDAIVIPDAALEVGVDAADSGVACSSNGTPCNAGTNCCASCTQQNVCGVCTPNFAQCGGQTCCLGRSCLPNDSGTSSCR